MYKETSKTRLKTLFLIIGAVAFYLIVLSIIDLFNLPYRGIIQAVLLLIIAVSVYVFTRYNLYVYEYNIIDDELVVISKLGEAERLIANVSFNDIEYIAPYGHGALEASKEVFRYNAKRSLSNKGVYILVFLDEKGRISKLSFDPSETLLKKLKDFGIQIYEN